MTGFFQGSAVRSAPPARGLPQCGVCGLSKKCNTPKLPVHGTGTRRVLFVGESPGQEEDEQGRPFVGKAGKFLRENLRRCGFNLEKEGWATYATICASKGRTPTPAEVGYCRPNMSSAIRDFDPDVIIPMGLAAVNSVLGPVWKEDIGQMARWVGWNIPSHALNAWVCPTWSPNQLVRDEDEVLDKQFATHLATALGHTGKPWPSGAPDYARNVRQVLDPAAAAVWLRKCAAQTTGAIAWDYEANMLKPDNDDARIASCSVAWGRTEPERCIAFPWHGEAITAMSELLCSPIPKIASNLKFEERWTRKHLGHRVRAWAWDTMLAAHVCDNRPGITSVKFQSFVRFGVPIWNEKIEPFLKSKGDEQVNAVFREIAIGDLLRYNGLDSWLEFLVAVDQCRELGVDLPWPT